MSPSPTTPDGIILVMGMTGSGKSSFIKLVTEDSGIKIGHGVESETSDIGVHNWTASDGRVFALVDSPGFDDSNGKTDANVLDKIASFLKERYGKISGLIYCQRIDVRAGGLTIRNLRMFHRVCGLALENTVIVTTRWDVVGDERAVILEQQLVTGEKYFKPLCEAGATPFGHNNTHASAQQIMGRLLDNIPIVLQMQEELEAGKTLEETAAGSVLSAEMSALIKKHEEEMMKLREEMEEANKARDKAWQKELNDELAGLKKDVQRLIAGIGQLKQPPSYSMTQEGAGQAAVAGMPGGAALGDAAKTNGGTTTPKKEPPGGIILVMGMTGSGKSSFIKRITEDPGIKIGHGVRSETSDIGVYDWTAPDGRVFALVDTPGFDDSNGKSDSDVLDQIAGFLMETYGKITGLIYCHRIDTRAGGLTIRNLRMFEKVCGLALKNAVIVTTRWDVVGKETAVDLERQLVTDEEYFKPLCDAGATSIGHNNTRASAQQIMGQLLNNIPIVLQMQEELETGKTLEETAAGAEISAELSAAIEKYEAEIKKVRKEMEDAMKAKDKAWQNKLNVKLGKLQGAVERSSTAGKERLKLPPSKSNIWQRVKCLSGEGAKRAGFGGRFLGFGGAAVLEGYRALKIGKAAVSRGKTMKGAKEEYEREFNHVVTSAASMIDIRGGSKVSKLARGTAGYLAGAMDVLANNVPPEETVEDAIVPEASDHSSG